MAWAQSVNFALPAQPLSDSLKAVAQQTGQNILFTPQAVEGQVAPELRGQMSGREAVSALLKGTNLEADPDGNGGLIVHARGDTARAEPQRGAAGRPASPARAGQPWRLSAAHAGHGGYRGPAAARCVH
ncbi:MAG: STN domain-containing protein [Alphaproteobacteria bacterium]|nr:STN domain-containing protein [Alphaproteobacteria bacterium]